MDDKQWQHQWDLFRKVLEVPVAERAAYLDRECAGDQTLQSNVELLLAGLARGSGILDHPGGSIGATALDDSGADQIGRRIGRYRIEGLLGAGGMGVVYAAQQEEPVRRRVALKLVRLGMNSREVVARFEAERQALAIMNHPGIATVFDAGVTEEGRPYFVMEYVPGIPITEYCDLRGLGLSKRMELFGKACEALEHAHKHGIIHRDVKPSNVLVASVEGKPSLKIIDFGVAKAIGQPLTDSDPFTRHGLMIGTPEYMSPEQAGTTALEVDARTDVYALGVLLYELLVGALPFDPTTLRRAAAMEMLRIIREEEPPRLSVRFSSLGEEATSIATLRHLDTRAMARKLRGELEWITMRALDKDPDRRYGTAAAMGADVGRYLEHRPVEAGPPGALYRLNRFVRRRRRSMIAAGLFVVMVVAFGVAMTMQSRRALDLARAGALAQTELAEMTERARRTERGGLVVRQVWQNGDGMGRPSPDGRYLSFVDWRTGDIAIRDLTTGESRTVTTDGTWEQPPRFGDTSIWSPDGAQIAFCWIDEGEGTDLRVVNADGTNLRILYHDPDVGYPWPRAWSRDGKHILAIFCRNDGSEPHEGPHEIALVSVEDGSLRRIKTLGDRHTRYMDLSADGRSVIYDMPTEKDGDTRDIFVVSTDDGQTTQVIDDPADDWGPCYSSDGRSILFASDRSGVQGLWMVAIEGDRLVGEPRPVKQGLGNEFRPMGITQDDEYFYATWSMSSEVYVARVDLARGGVESTERVSQRFSGSNAVPFWSADGSELAWISRRSLDDTGIVVRSEDGVERDVIVPGDRLLVPSGWASPSWHPNGRSFLVHRARDSGARLGLVDVETGVEQPIVDARGQPVHGQWAVLVGGGSRMLYVTETADAIVAFDMTTRRKTHRHTVDGYIYSIAPSPDERQLAYLEADELFKSRRIVIIPLEGGPARILYELPDGERFPWGTGLTWTPDGASLLVGRGNAEKEPVELWRVSANSGAATSVMTFPRGRVRHVSVHPDGQRIAYGLETPSAEGIWSLSGFVAEE